jgi:hypothetical protein
MGLTSFDRFEKVKYGSDEYGERNSRRHAEATAERFNEPAVILEGPKEFVVLRGISWAARDSWGKSDLPKWAKEDPESVRIATVYPKDNLAGHYKKAVNLVERMMKKAMAVRYEDRFDLEDLCRDYPKVRQQMNIAEKQADALHLTLLYVQHEVEDAIADHKKNGQPKGRHGPSWGGE